MGFGKRLQDARKAMHMSGTALGVLCGVKKQTVSNWEADRNDPDLGQLEIICRELMVTADWLVRGLPTLGDLSDAEGRLAMLYRQLGADGKGEAQSALGAEAMRLAEGGSPASGQLDERERTLIEAHRKLAPRLPKTGARAERVVQIINGLNTVQADRLQYALGEAIAVVAAVKAGRQYITKPAPQPSQTPTQELRAESETQPTDDLVSAARRTGAPSAPPRNQR